MMWKTLIFLTVASAVLAGRIRKHHANYKFYVKHDYDYGQHEKLEHKHQNEEEVQQEEEKKEEQLVEPEKQEENNIREQNDEQERNDGKEENEQKEEQEQGEVNDESHKPENHEEYDYPSYEFLYKVQDPYSHDLKGMHEKKYGDEVNGAYWLMQPDGYKRTVTYHANKHSGFLAEVDYSKPEEHKDNEKLDTNHYYKHYHKIHHDYKVDHEKHEKENEGDEKPTSEYLITTYHGLKKPIPVKEEADEEGDHQKESAKQIPIYVV